MSDGASDGAKAACPECSAEISLGLLELGAEITCGNCGTVFVVERHRRRGEKHHHLRTECMLDYWCLEPKLPVRVRRRAMWRVFGLCLTAVVVVLVIVNWAVVRPKVDKGWKALKAYVRTER